MRNDYRGINESREQMMQRTRNDYFHRTKPSANKPQRLRDVPPGCISVYRVHKWDGRRNTYYGVFRDEALAYQVADDEWSKVVGPFWSREVHISVKVEHKAALLIDGRYYIVNLDPIKFSEPPDCVPVLLGGTGVQQEVAA